MKMLKQITFYICVLAVSYTHLDVYKRQALNQLSKRHRQVLQLHYLDGLSYKQIEEILPIKYQAIRNYVHEGLKVMRKKMVS